MIAMKFTIELDIGLSFPLQAALPQLVTDRETKTHRRGRSKRSYGHCRRRTGSRRRNPDRHTPIAVGTAVAGGPPHRSQRALLAHWAPPLGVGVEPRVGIGMRHAGGR
jgi:hypothetical protein